MGIFGLVLGIVGLLASLAGAIWPIGNLVSIIGLVLACAGIVLSVLDMKKSEKHGKATAGLVLSIIAVVIGVIMLLACGGTKKAINDVYNQTVDTVSQYSEEELSTLTEEQLQSEINSIVDNVAPELTQSTNN